MTDVGIVLGAPRPYFGGPSVHTLRIELLHVEPTVWRRFIVPSETKLPKFNRMLQAAMGWEGYHLHMFEIADLRIGLPWQSLHNGERCLHTPLRLTVVIDAPREAIDTVIAQHETVQQLVNNRWLYLMRFEGELMEIYRQGCWQKWQS